MCPQHLHTHSHPTRSGASRDTASFLPGIYPVTCREEGTVFTSRTSRAVSGSPPESTTLLELVGLKGAAGSGTSWTNLALIHGSRKEMRGWQWQDREGRRWG